MLCVEQLLTLQAESLLKDMVENIVKQQTLTNMANIYSIQQTIDVGEKGSAAYTAFTNTSIGSTKDIFGQDKQKLKTSDSSRYFNCDNCGRKISGGRFAQHVNKCLERRRR